MKTKIEQELLERAKIEEELEKKLKREAEKKIQEERRVRIEKEKAERLAKEEFEERKQALKCQKELEEKHIQEQERRQQV